MGKVTVETEGFDGFGLTVTVFKDLPPEKEQISSSACGYAVPTEFKMGIEEDE